MSAYYEAVKNWTAIRRKGRGTNSTDPLASFPPDRQPVAIAMPARTEPNGGPTGPLDDVTIQGAIVGVEVPEGGYTIADNLRTSDCDVGVDNRGRFDGPDTLIG
jgi:hypothetical protein